MGILSTIFGTGTVVSDGFKLIDSMYDSDSELMVADADSQVKIITAKAKAKTDLVDSYTPYKVAQRYLGIMFAAQYMLVLNITLVITLWNGGSVDDVIKLMSTFYLGEIVLTIIGFYFAGGAVEGVVNRFKNKADNK